MYADVIRARFPKDRRIAAVSDIHGNLDLFRALLDKIGYGENDILILIGDLCNKGEQNEETLEYIMTLARREDVYVLRGNGDLPRAWMTPAQRAFIESLPHILETPEYIFVHAALSDAPIDRQDAEQCMKCYNFIEKAGCFDKWVVTGHWPVANYCHRIPSQDPFFDAEKKIVGIDGGCVVRWDGQLNALLIENGSFSFDFVDDYPRYTAPHAQAQSGGTLHITYEDRRVELLEKRGRLNTIRHLKTGTVLRVPDWAIYENEEGKLCGGSGATDFFLPVEEGETLGLVYREGDLLFLKKGRTVGWYLE